MFAIAALICFILAMLDVKAGDFSTANITALGLAFLAIHLLYSWTPWDNRRRP